MDGALLLQDKDGEKPSILQIPLYKRTVAVNVLRGELLVPIPGDKITPRNDGRKPDNYRVKSDATITLYCTPQEVAPLINYEFLLLEAVSSPHVRFSMFLSDHILDWGQKLKPGDDVYVAIPGSTLISHPSTPRAAAKVRFVGGLGVPPDSRGGLFFGVEIMEERYRGQYTTDGTFKGDRYFSCEDNCGLFVSLDKLSPDREGSTLERPPPGGQEHARSAGSTQVPPRPPQANHRPDPGRPDPGVRGHPMSTRSKLGTDLDAPRQPQFAIGDRVVVITKMGTPVHGEVRWTDKSTAKRVFEHYVVGIETDCPVRKDNIEGALSGMTHLFTVKHKGNQLIVPEGLVLPEEKPVAAVRKPSPTPRESRDRKAEVGGVTLSEAEVAENQEALNELEKNKLKENARKVLPNESLNLSEQQEEFQRYEEQRARIREEEFQRYEEQRARMREPPQDGARQYADVAGGHIEESHFQRQDHVREQGEHLGVPSVPGLKKAQSLPYPKPPEHPYEDIERFRSGGLEEPPQDGARQYADVAGGHIKEHLSENVQPTDPPLQPSLGGHPPMITDSPPLRTAVGHHPHVRLPPQPLKQIGFPCPVRTMAGQPHARGGSRGGGLGEKHPKVLRDDISDYIQAIRMDAKKGMRQYEPPAELFQMARNFVSWAPNVTRTGYRLRFKEDCYYHLLILHAQAKKVSSLDRRAFELIDGWQVAVKALFRYALNLYLTPKRPEFRRVKLTNSYYVYNVDGKLGNAKDILVAMGYRPVTASSPATAIQELLYEGEVDKERVVSMATDLIILCSELDIVKEAANQVVGETSTTSDLHHVALEDILQDRSKDGQQYELHSRLIKLAFQRKSRQQQPPPVSYQRQSSERVQSSPVQHVQVPDPYRRGSAPHGQISSTLAPEEGSRRVSSYHTPPMDPRLEELGGGRRQVDPGVYYDNIPGSSQAHSGQTPTENRALDHPGQYRTSRDKERTGDLFCGGSDRTSIADRDAGLEKRAAPVHEMLHGKNLSQNAQPTDPPLQPSLGDHPPMITDSPPLRTAVGHHPHVHLPPQSVSSRNVYHRGVEESLPKGQNPQSHYANIGETLHNATGGPTTPGSLYKNTSSLQQDSGEEPSLPKTSTPERKGILVGRSKRVNTLDRDMHVQALYARFPDLANSFKEDDEKAASFEDSLMYGDTEEGVGDRGLETTYEEGELSPELSSCDFQNLPEPVAKTKEDLGRLAPSGSSSSFLSMNPEIKDVHSVHDEHYGGPDFSLSIPPPGGDTRSPELEVGGSVNNKWRVSTTSEYSGPPNQTCETEKSPSSSLEQTSSASEEMYGRTSLDDTHGEQYPEDSQEEHLKSDINTKQTEKPVPRPRLGLTQRSNTMNEPERERVRLPSKSNSASKLVDSSSQTEQRSTVKRETGAQDPPSERRPPMRSPVPSPRRRKPGTSPRLQRRQEQLQPSDREEPRPREELGRTHVPTASDKPASTEPRHKAKTPSTLQFGKNKSSQDLKSPPTVKDSTVSATQPDKAGQKDKFKSFLKNLPETPNSPFEEKFWVCAFCTNLVSAPINVCDICGTTKKSTN